jgi:phosphate starvation-inducible PhoH-like protein/PhoH-like ATPase
VPRKSTKKNDNIIVPQVDMLSEYSNNMRDIKPITDSQIEAYEQWEKGRNLILSGAAGSGKTFIALYLALQELIKNRKKRLVILRSVVPTRDIGFLPGTQEEKEAAYLTPYIGVISEIFKNNPTLFTSFLKNGTIEFLTTSYIRGITLKDAIVVVDEFQNCNFHELDSIITRIGKGSRVIFSGDYYQSDFTNRKEKEGIGEFLKIIESLKHFKKIEFTWKDCVRSGMVRDYLMTKEKMIEDNTINIPK